MAAALDPITKKLGSFVNGNNKNVIWGALLNKMVQRYPQVASVATPPPNAPANNYLVITPPARGTNDDISLIIDHLNYDDKGEDEDPE